MVQKVDLAAVKSLIGRGDIASAEKMFNGNESELIAFLKQHGLFSTEVKARFEKH